MMLSWMTRIVLGLGLLWLFALVCFGLFWFAFLAFATEMENDG